MRVSVLGLIMLLFAGGAQELSASEMRRFGRCISKSGATFYAAWWCPHCARQIDLLGDVARELRTVQCSERGSRELTSRCSHIAGVPTWTFASGQVAQGALSVSQLAAMTGCRAPR